MKKAITIFQFSLLLTGAFFSLATSPADRSIVFPSTDDTWVAANFYDAQTSFPVDGFLDLHIGYDDFLDDPTISGRTETPDFETDVFDISEGSATMKRTVKGLEQITIINTETGTAIPFTAEIRRRSSRLTPDESLKPNQRYTVLFHDIANQMNIQRPVPSQITFSTAAVLHVMDIRQNEDTVIIAFSAPLDPNSAFLSSGSIDVVWQEGEYVFSLSADTNTADYLFEVDENLFMITSLNSLRLFPTWLRIGTIVAGVDKEPVVQKDNAELDQAVVLVPIEWGGLAECQTRPDIPEPCVTDTTEALIESNRRDNDW